jgi:malate dehydrogenase (oxaloacetate-decarboxylating)(NADP+)
MKFKEKFATATGELSLDQAMKDADVLIGLSSGNVVSQDMIRSMAKHPIVFAMANPDPEISWEEAIAARKDLIMATGRSDYPNQVNNVSWVPLHLQGSIGRESHADQ